MYGKKKKVILHDLADKEFKKLDLSLQKYFLSIFELFEELGELREPESKKLAGYKNIFELRLRHNGQWRAFYGYKKDDFVLIVHFLHKKTQKISIKTLNLIEKRLKEYE